jgi:hypothetical protein
MITFSRSTLVGAEFLDETTLRFHGILEDHIYAMEIQMDVCIPDGVIIAIEGSMKRYTNPVCPKAVDVLQDAVGVSLREEGWASRIYREIGRKGCQHFAEILIECGRCLDLARMTHDLTPTIATDPAASTAELAKTWLRQHPEVHGSCMAQPTEGSAGAN